MTVIRVCCFFIFISAIVGFGYSTAVQQLDSGDLYPITVEDRINTIELGIGSLDNGVSTNLVVGGSAITIVDGVITLIGGISIGGSTATYEIWNSGTAPMEWTATTPETWISLTLSNTVIATENDEGSILVEVLTPPIVDTYAIITVTSGLVGEPHDQIQEITYKWIAP